MTAMEKPSRAQLLPGVTIAEVPPVAVLESLDVVRRARRRAALRDAADLLLLTLVDVLFIRWPQAHIPTLDRHDSLDLLFAVNVLLVAYIWLHRRLPEWRARRVAETWCTSERSRLVR